MRKKLLTGAVAVLVALALAFGGWTVYHRLTQGRSWAATTFVWQFHKDEYTTEEALAAYLAEKSAENALPYTIPSDVAMTVSVSRHIYRELDYLVLNQEGSGVLFYFAGGSYIDQPRAVHRQFLNHLAEDTGMTIVVPLYPKLPEADAAACCEVLLDFYAQYDMGQGPVYFMGDSAGGGLALSLAMQIRDAGLAGPEKLVLLSPWVDVSMSNPAISDYEAADPALDAAMLARLGLLWADELDVTDPVVSPLYGDFTGLGAITVFVGTNELLYPDICALDEALTQSGVSHTMEVGQKMFHVWPLYLDYGIPESQAAYEAIVAALM